MRRLTIRRAVRAAVTIAGVATLPLHALAQEVTSDEVQRAAQVKKAIKANETQPPAPIPPSLNPVQTAGEYLFERGFYFTSRYTAQFAANPIGGQRPGGRDYNGGVTFGVTVDMAKLGLVPIQGGFIHALFEDNHGRLLSNQALNSDISTQFQYGPQTYQLAIFTYQQKLFNDRLDINFGRTDGAFVQSPYFCDFMSHANCGRPQLLLKITSSSVYPTAIWGGRAAFDITKNFYGKVGIYQPNPGLNSFIFHGFDWSISSKQGYVLPVEFGYKYASPGMTIENKYNIGFIYSHAPFTQPFLPKQTLINRGAFYAQFQQTLWQPERSQRGISAFGYLLTSTTPQTAAQRLEYSAGIVWQGPFASRPRDRLDFMFANYIISGQYLNTLYATRVKAGGTQYPFSNQLVLEANYDFQLTPWAHVMPNIQYMSHPDGLGTGEAYPVVNSKNAVILGAQATIDLTTLFGVPDYPLPLVFDN